MNIQTKVSIIVPVYNVEHYLEACIESLLMQTLTEIEIILVNDGSNDGSNDILNRYKEQYKEKIKVINKENTGPGDSRNEGLKIATGEYIGFVDSDDWIDMRMYEKLYNLAKKGYDIVCCDLVRVNNNGKQNVIKPYGGSIPSNQKEFVKMSFNNVAPCNKIYKKSLIEDIKYPSFWYEDFGFTPVAISKSKKMAYLGEALYYYRESKSSVTASQLDFRIKDIINSCEYAIKYMNLEFKDEFMYSVIMRMYRYINEKWYFKDIFIEFLKKYRNYFSDNIYLKKEKKDINLYNLIIDDLLPKKLHYVSYNNNFKDNFVNDSKILEGYEVIIWDKEKCLKYINELSSKRLEEFSEEQLNDYLKLKILYDNGGFILDGDMIVNGYLGSLRIYNHIFSFVDNEKIGLKFLGAKKNSNLIKSFIKEIELSEKYSKPVKTEDIITDVLNIHEGMSVDGKRQYLKNNICILSPREALYNLDDELNFVEKNKDNSKDIYLYIKNQLLEQQKEIEKLKSENEKLSRANFVYMNSTSWKITKGLRVIGDIVKKFKK